MEPSRQYLHCFFHAYLFLQCLLKIKLKESLSFFANNGNNALSVAQHCIVLVRQTYFMLSIRKYAI